MLLYSNLVEKMLAQFPSLCSDFENNYDEEEQALVHIIFGQLFNPYVIEKFCTGQQCEEEKRHIADFLEEMATSSDEKVRAVLTDTVLEELLDDSSSFSQISAYFKEKTRALSDDVQIAYKMFWGK